MRYSNPWSGKSNFYKGRTKRLPTAETDKDYQLYCSRKLNKDKLLSYRDWCKKERRNGGMF
jgi:hypothetical protein